ncbi:MAG: hypothetical protein Q8L09_01305 [Candidatus Moranbacteria bacterium]|nr:hypothetical protein [Candidatus Moranbacteria bacterium]
MATPGKKKKNGYPKPVFREIFICAKKELSPYGSVFALSPGNYEQEKLGALFGILKILDFSADSSYVVNLLTSVIKKEYFSRPERSAEESFEASLRKANLALAELARHGTTGWAGKISFAGGAIERNNLHFSHLGDTSVYLIRSGQIAQISKGLDEGKTSEPHPLKTFTDISSGKLEKGDKIIFATSDLMDIFSPDELRHNAARFSREEFTGLIEASLHANTELGGVIVIDLLDQAEIKALFDSSRTRQARSEKMAALPPLDEAKKTDVFSPAPKKQAPVLSGIKAPPAREKQSNLYIKEEETKTQKIFFTAKIFSSLKSFCLAAAKYITAFFKNLAAFFRRLEIKEKIFFLFRGKMKPGHLVEKITGHSRYFAGRISRIGSGKKKFYAGIVSAAVLVLILGAVLFKAFSKKTAPEPANQTGVQVEVPTPKPPILEDKQIKSVSEPETVVDLPQKTNNIAILDNSLFAIPESGKSILKINPESKNVEEFPCNLENARNFKLLAPMPHLKTIFILTEDRKIISFTPVNKNFQENLIELPPNVNPINMKSYLTYLYFLDASANQIYRYPRAEGGFGDRQDWLKPGSDIKGALDFALNDDLYVASGNGITAYLQGRKDDTITFEKPAVSLKIDKIYSAPGMENIYALDNKNHRIIQYSKDGKIVSQFWNTSISNVTDFVADEINKSVFLLQDKKILKFSLE